LGWAASTRSRTATKVGAGMPRRRHALDVPGTEVQGGVERERPVPDILDTLTRQPDVGGLDRREALAGHATDPNGPPLRERPVRVPVWEGRGALALRAYSGHFRSLRQQPFGKVQPFLSLDHLLPTRSHLLVQRLETAGGLGVRAWRATLGVNLRDPDCAPTSRWRRRP
jgi:hypothetical protein